MERVLSPNNGGAEEDEEGRKPKVVVIMGPTGSGKSRLAIDLASHFPIEIINADSMQVYQGLDILTNKVPLPDQRGVPHHLLGTVSPSVEFTSKNFRDSAIPLINDILSRNCLPVIVGGTNYYIQALMSPFLVDDLGEDMDERCLSDPPGDMPPEYKIDFGRDKLNYNYQCLKDIDPVAANRIHPNDFRKINQYLSLYNRFGVIPSKIFQGKAAENIFGLGTSSASSFCREDVLALLKMWFKIYGHFPKLQMPSCLWQNWGQADNFRYNCCFLCVDASFPVLDQYVEQRVDCMIESGLLSEVYEIYSLNADYTRGLRQAIGVREFEDFLRVYLSEGGNGKDNALTDGFHLQASIKKDDKLLKENMRAILGSSSDDQRKILLKEAIDKVKANTRRLVRRQKRRLNRLQTFFGWTIHYVDSTESLISKSNDSWVAHVVKPSVKIISSFLNEDASWVPDSEAGRGIGGPLSIQRDLWTRYTCEACGNKVLRGAHEWEQHRQGRGHRKRISQLRRKSQNSCTIKPQQQHAGSE